MARFYANGNFPRIAVERLRSLGHDVLTAGEAGRDNRRIPDEEVLAFATAERRIVLILNRSDFIRRHRRQLAHRGIVVCTEDAERVGQAERIDADVVALERLDGELVRVNRPNRRV